MRTSRFLRSSIAVLAVTAAACDPSASSPVEPQALEPLGSTTWLMVAADGQSLPAVVAHRLLEGNVLEESVLESAQLIVDADGGYEQLFRIRTLANGVQQSNVLVQDFGVWTAGTERYDLESDTRTRSFRLDPIVDDTLRSTEAMVFRPEAGLVRGRYVPIAPAVR